MEKWVERLPKTLIIVELDLVGDINQFYYKFSKKQQIYNISDNH